MKAKTSTDRFVRNCFAVTMAMSLSDCLEQMVKEHQELGDKLAAISARLRVEEKLSRNNNIPRK